MYSIATNSSHVLQADDRNGRPLAAVGLVIVAAPLWWALGLNLLVYHVTALLAFTLLLVESSYDNRKLSVPFVAWLLLAISAIYGFSIVLNCASYDAMRIVAAANNLSYWLMGPMLIIVIASRFRLRHLAGLLRIFPVLGVFNVLIALVAAAIALRGVSSLSIPTPLCHLENFLGKTALVAYSVHIRLIVEDYFVGGSTPRFNLYAPYPTAAGAFFMISLPMLLTWAACTKRLSSPVLWLLVVGHVVGLGMTLARMAILGLGASAMVVYILQKRNVVAWGMFIVGVSLLATPLLLRSAETVVAAREGSSRSRLALYKESVQQLEGVEWVFGRGIRAYSEKHGMPLGSHSTYVSLLYRTGLAGLATFLLLQGVLLVRWYQLKRVARLNREHFLVWRALGIVFVSMALWMLTEDIDVPQLLAFMYFGAIGVVEGLRSELIERSSRATCGDWGGLAGVNRAVTGTRAHGLGTESSGYGGI